MSTRILRPLKIIAMLYLAYLALVLLIATPLVNVFVPKIYREQTGAELKLGKIIWLNPFTLSITVRAVSSVNSDNSPFWSFDELDANLSIASLWRRHLVLDSLSLNGIDVQIEQTASDRFNFANILEYRAKHFPAPATATKKSDEPFAIEITRLNIAANHIGLRASHLAEPIDATLNTVDFTLANFSTAAQKPLSSSSEKPVAISSATANKLQFNIATLNAKFLREQNPFALALHNLKMVMPELSTLKNSDYEFSAIDSGNGTLNIEGTLTTAQNIATGHAQLRGVSILPMWQFLANKLAFDMKDAKLDGDIKYSANWTETLRYTVENSALTLRDVQLQARDDNASHVELSSLQIDDINVDSAQPSAHIGKAALDKLNVAGWNKDTHVSLVDMFAYRSDEPKTDTPPWQIQIDEIALQSGAVHWHASQIDQLPLELAPLDARLNNVHWPDAAAMQLNAKTSINKTAQLILNGAITPTTQSGDVQADVRNLPLAWGDAFVRQQMRATLANGTFGAHAAIKLDHAQPISIQSDGTIEQFELRALQQTSAAQKIAENPKLAAWQKLEWQQLTLAPSQQRIRIKQIVVTQPWTQFRINADGTNNFQQLLIASNNGSNNKTAGATQPAKNATASVTTEKSPTNKNAKLWQYAIDNVHVNRATLDFRDASLTSAFRTNITELSGDIEGLDSSGKKAAKVGLRGTVDGYAPVALTGLVDPFATRPALDITIDMTNLDLATLTPYSGTYAGYQIDGGRLSVQLAYTLENGRIKGTNHIVVNQMKLGKQVHGPKVVDLPLRLAIYLLTDSNGVMDLGVDVTGNASDPDFSVGNIIWKAFRNMIFKTVTSPFRALGHLIGSTRDDLDRIEFIAGSNQLAPHENEKLETINKALLQKPALKLAITGHVSPAHDLEALSDNSLSAQLIAQGGIKQTDIQQQSPNWQREVVKLFKKRFPNEDATRWQVMQMNDAMRDNIELNADALPQLAARRALAVKEALVTDYALSPDRLFIKPIDIGADKNPGAQVTMEVE